MICEQFPKLRYAVAHIDALKVEGKVRAERRKVSQGCVSVQHLQKTPTFTFYRNGRRIDEICGTNMQALKDRLWLYQD